MKEPAPKPNLYSVKGSDLSLSGPALVSLMEAVLAKGVTFRFRAKGWSMAPFIRDRDVISVSPLRKARPGLGEVVAFVRPDTGKLIVHRVIGRKPGFCLIQGDNMPGWTDGTIPLENILGRVTRVERDGRTMHLGLGTDRLLIALLSRSGWLRVAKLSLGPLLRPFRRKTTSDPLLVQNTLTKDGDE